MHSTWPFSPDMADTWLSFASEESTTSPIRIYLDLLPGHFSAADRLPVSILEEDWSRPFPMMSKQLQSRFMAHARLISVGTTYPLLLASVPSFSLLYCISSSSFQMGGEGGRSPSNPQPIIDSILACTACASDGSFKDRFGTSALLLLLCGRDSIIGLNVVPGHPADQGAYRSELSWTSTVLC
jgi:hypothetical protein